MMRTWMAAFCFALVVCTAAGAAPAGEAAPAAPDLTLRFKPLFPKVGGYPLLCSAAKEGAVTLEEQDVFQEKPALRLDCGKTKERVIGLGCYIHPDKLAPYRGKALVFRVQLKWLKGEGDLTLQMRASGQKVAGTIATQAKFAGEKGRWVPFELHATVPPMPEVDTVNFMVWLTKSADPAVVLVDECTLSPDAGTEAANRPRGFAAYERTAGEKALPIVRDGKPAATSVVGQPMSKALRYAVQELNEHLKLATGAALPVANADTPVSGPTLHLGKTPLTERLGLAPSFFSPDHWTVQRVGDALILSGGDASFDEEPVGTGLAPFGTLYAVYEFLERVVGARWYWPGDLGRVVPKRAEISIGDVAWYGAPTYETRFAFYAMPKDEGFTPRDAVAWWRRMRWGGVNGSPIGMHSFNQWPKRFGDTHPDWFALQRNGQRAAHDPGGYVCFSEPAVFDQTLADVRADLDARPNIRYRTVMPGDGMFECQCPRCQARQAPPGGPPAGRWSDLVWTFVNRVAAEVHKSHPDRVITCCAYSEYREPPEKVTLLPNVAVTLCTNYLPSVWQPNAKADYLKELGAWSRKTANITVWDYWYARRGAGTHGAPSIFPRAMKEWFALERGRVRGRVIENCEFWADGRSSHDWADWMFDAQNMYVAMRLMWNGDEDVDRLLSEYYEHLYGPAAPLVRRFYDEMEAAWADPNTKGGDPKPAWDWSTCWLKTYPPERVQRVMGYLRQAEEATRGKEPFHARVAKTLTGFLPFEAASQRYVGSASAAVRNQEIAVTQTAAAPAIDGSLEDPCWKDAPLAEHFTDMYNSPKLRASTSFRLARDAKNLYVAIRADLPDGQYRHTLADNSRDGYVWNDESCEIFFVQGKRKVQILVGPGDIYADALHPDMEKEFSMEMFGWNCAGVQYKTRRGEKEWTAEVAVPLASLELPAPKKDAPWKVNFCRNCYYRLPGGAEWQWEISSWRPAFGSFHNVDRFGDLWFQP